MERTELKINTIVDLRNQLNETFSDLCCDYMDLFLENKIIDNGIGFFPYGSGLVSDDKVNLPQNGIMIVGQDFGTKTYLTEDVLLKGEVGNRTYNNILSVIPVYERNDYFLTNLLIGLRTTSSMTGKNPVLSKSDINKTYLDACFNFFETQLNLTAPKLIIALGRIPFEELLKRYDVNDFVNFKVYNSGEKKHCIEVKGNRYKLVVIPHPSMWHFNLNKEGKEDILKLLRS